MTGPAAVPTALRPQCVVGGGSSWEGEFRAMASRVRLVLGAGTSDPQDVLDDVESLFAQVERECTRFDPASDLMRANAAGAHWHGVGPYCLAALEAAQQAHRDTGGLFDPRVLRTLCALGYDRSLPFVDGDVRVAAGVEVQHARRPWHLGVDRATSRVRIGPDPVDLGGIGKGLAVRWAAELTATRSPSFLVDAGGDCYVRGFGPDDAGWHVGVEDPRGGALPVLVLALADTACVTSSIRVRQWTAGDRLVHHLIDPRTGTSAVADLLAVTVIAPDPAHAEVLAKVLFLQGARGIARAADDAGVGAVWITADGDVRHNDAAAAHIVWRAAA